jgi:DNA-3-methyladenine glycosylase II
MVSQVTTDAAHLSVAFRQAEELLGALDGNWAALIASVGPCQLKLKEQRDPYEALVRAIAYQQLHAKAAEAILARFVDLFPTRSFPAPEEILATDPNLMRGCGFSAAKVETIRGIALGAQQGVVPSMQTAQQMSDEALIAQLVTLRGIGRWTVEMMLIFTLGRLDILPVDDFGVREGLRLLYEMPAQPKPRQAKELGETFRPYRSIATWYLWRAAERAKAAARQASQD